MEIIRFYDYILNLYRHLSNFTAFSSCVCLPAPIHLQETGPTILSSTVTSEIHPGPCCFRFGFQAPPSPVRQGFLLCNLLTWGGNGPRPVARVLRAGSDPAASFWCAQLRGKHFLCTISFNSYTFRKARSPTPILSMGRQRPKETKAPAPGHKARSLPPWEACPPPALAAPGQAGPWDGAPSLWPLLPNLCLRGKQEESE